MMLAAKQLGKTYTAAGRSVEALRDVGLELQAGEFLAIVGRSGSGKSTLLALLSGLARPTHGQVLYQGNDLWTLSEARRATIRNQELGFVFQFSSLLPTMRVLDNVALPALLHGGDAPATYVRATELLVRVGLAARLDAYPAELSGGEQRRVVLARALINRPALLFADEPTADLDEETEAEIFELMIDNARTEQAALVLVTHNVQLARRADRIITVKQGRVVQEVTPAHVDLLAQPVDQLARRASEADPPLARRASADVDPAPMFGQVPSLWSKVALWAVPVVLLLLAVDYGIGLYQARLREEKRAARRTLEEAAWFRLQADIADIAYGPDQSYRLTLFLQNRQPDQPISTTTPSVRAFVQMGIGWQEIPLKHVDAERGRVLDLAGRQTFAFVFEPQISGFAELLPGYMHVRFTNTMLVRPHEGDDLLERSDDYYVYLKPHGADDAILARANKFPGKPPLWIPMPAH